MPRDLPIGNGSLLINFDNDYHIRDIYYPHVGQFNHTLGHRSRLGIWANGMFSWVHTRDWKKKLSYEPETLITRVTLSNEHLGIELVCNDLVDCFKDVFIRRLTIRNFGGSFTGVKLFISHDLHLNETIGCDTAYYEPELKSIIHYKRNQYFLINICQDGEIGIKHFAIGLQDFRGAEGTWRDAEDGILSGDAIADGSVDSTIGIYIGNLPQGDKSTIYYWMAAGRTLEDVINLNNYVIEETPEHLINRTSSYWRTWVRKGIKNVSQIQFLPKEAIEFYARSLLILRTQIDNDGAILAANDYDPVTTGMDGYSYLWPRDGAMIAYALDEAGYPEITDKFFRFSANVITSDGYFRHKYHPDGTVGSSWHPLLANGNVQNPIQEDSTALVVWAFWHHFAKWQNFELVKSLYEPLVTRPGNFMSKYIDATTGLPLPSYDPWEERYGIHTYTSSAVYAGLKSASNFARLFNETEKADQFEAISSKIRDNINIHLFDKTQKRFIRTLFKNNEGYLPDLTVDSNLYSVFAFELYGANDERVKNTMDSIKGSLSVRTSIGGVARYKGDHLHKVSDDVDNVPGNPWIICTLWLAQYLIASAKDVSDLSEPLNLIDWVISHSLESGAIPEQLHPYTGQPLSVCPLSWSHGEFIITVNRLLTKVRIFYGN